MLDALGDLLVVGRAGLPDQHRELRRGQPALRRVVLLVEGLGQLAGLGEAGDVDLIKRLHGQPAVDALGWL